MAHEVKKGKDPRAADECSMVSSCFDINTSAHKSLNFILVGATQDIRVDVVREPLSVVLVVLYGQAEVLVGEEPYKVLELLSLVFISWIFHHLQKELLEFVPD
uniref:Uncharacterized protein n=1 Tax=Strombidium inclinatum TaxID=197538 RepID=A0A7S3IH68_9SPIT